MRTRPKAKTDEGRRFFDELLRAKRSKHAAPIKRAVVLLPRGRKRLELNWSPEFLLVIPVLAVAGLVGLKFASSPWPVSTTFRHMLAFRNCDAVRSVGLAPAYRGEPGYYAHHDRDGDGWACEPWPR
jgi:hypothetical protein